MSLFIGIDSGTQSVKAVVLDLDTRNVVAEARAPHHLIAGLPAGHQEQHPADWTAALDYVLSEVASKIDGSRVRGLGVSGQQHGFVPLDAHGNVIRPAKLWCDTSTTAECALIMKKLGGPKATLRKTGNLVLPGFTAPKILWLKRHEPANFKKLRHVLLPHDYLNFLLTGNYFMEFGDASGTALMDVRHRTWSNEALKAIDSNLADWLPPLSESHEAAGTLRPEIAAKYGFSSEVVVSAGGEIFVDGVDRGARPRALAHIHERGTGSVAELHEVISREMEIEKIMRQQHVTQAFEIRGLVTFQPENFRRSETGQDQVARLANRRLRAAKFLRDERALGGCAGVAPELRRTNHFSGGVERHEAVLLPRNTDAAHARAINLRGDFEDDGVQRVGPLLRLLLHVADGQSVDQRMRSTRLGDHLAGVEIEDDGLDALRAGIDADKKRHNAEAMKPGIQNAPFMAS